VVTGAGRGLGRAYAELLGALGATVVVNDVDAEPGVTDTSDVASSEGAQALIDKTIEHHGRIDVLVNNAGIMRWADFPDVDDDTFAAHVAVHLNGSFFASRAAWPHMVAQGYGRIVMTTSTGLLGLRGNVPYAAAKGGVIGLTRALAFAGRDVGIKVNAIAPAAGTRLGGDGTPGMDPARAAPMAAFLAHENCPVSGEIYTAGGGRFARLFIGSTPGYVSVDPTIDPTVDDIVANWDAINDETGYVVPADLMEWSATFLSHLQ
jgi:NAD(P)-dependent dehydrogenase (short-subunit alcohol dehydrogenase family)